MRNFPRLSPHPTLGFFFLFCFPDLKMCLVTYLEMTGIHGTEKKITVTPGGWNSPSHTDLFCLLWVWVIVSAQKIRFFVIFLTLLKITGVIHGAFTPFSGKLWGNRIGWGYKSVQMTKWIDDLSWIINYHRTQTHERTRTHSHFSWQRLSRHRYPLVNL